MRTKSAMKNAVTSILLQIVLILSGLLVPRFFIACYGSAVNGLVSSISQFISYMSLVEAGISTAGIASLYQPVAKDDTDKVSGIVSAAREFYRNSGLIFAGLCVLLVIFYPFLVENQIHDLTFIRTMIVILCMNGLVDYFYLGKYRMLLMANQQGYILSIVQIIGTVLATVLSIVVIQLGLSALLAKGVVSIVYLLRSFAVGIYVRKTYPAVSFRSHPDRVAFGQRWAALVHQIASLVVYYTDTITMTLFLPENALVEVSVYSAYDLVGYALFGMMNSISNGVCSVFGNILSKNEKGTLRDGFSAYEYVFYILVFFCYSCMGTFLYAFISLYSASFADAALYPRQSAVLLFTAIGVLQTVRIPRQTIINAAGHFRQTQWRAILEACINLTVSIALVRPMGMTGVLIGTLCSHLYRTCDMIVYSERHLLSKALKNTLCRLFRNGFVMGVSIFAGLRLMRDCSVRWMGLIWRAAAFGIVALGLFLAVNALCERKTAVGIVRRLRKQ